MGWLTALFAGLAIGSLWFDVIILILAVAIALLLEKEKDVWTTFIFVGSLIALNYLYKLDAITYVRHHPLVVLKYAALYFVFGILWSIIKWAFFIHKFKAEYKAFKAKWLKENVKPGADKTLTAVMAAELMQRARHAGIKVEAPEASDNKDALARWGIYWPFSILGFLLNDLLRKSWNFIVECLQSTYERIAESIYHSVNKDAALARAYEDEQAKIKAEKQVADQANNRDPEENDVPRSQRRRG